MAVFRSRARIYITFSSLSSNHLLVRIFGSGPAVFCTADKMLEAHQTAQVENDSGFFFLLIPYEDRHSVTSTLEMYLYLEQYTQMTNLILQFDD
ncbi:NADPH:adrenodoxin oxidoreductase, mitochondrial-like [Silene latifolia]|uniref:NADPH:adrenodoxin oxidoreductase, mitochondrial-like n=1 Tax=Silene latifolia TaxID=37657 RepID=UPI003D782635